MIVMVVVFVVRRRRRITGEREPRTARRDAFDRRDVSDVPESDVGVLNTLIVVVYRRHATRRARRARPRRAPRSPALERLVLERPHFGAIARPRTHGRAPAGCFVDDAPFV